MTNGLHRCEASLNTLADHQHVSGFSEAHSTAPAWTQHHLLWLNRRLRAAVAGKKGAMDTHRGSVHPVHDEGHHRRPEPAKGMLQAGVEAQRAGRREADATGGEIL